MKAVVKLRTRRVHRRRYREYGLDRYRIERYLAPMWEGVKTVEELRERYRKFVDCQWIWDAMASIKDAAETEQAALESLDVAVKREFGSKVHRRKKTA